MFIPFVKKELVTPGYISEDDSRLFYLNDFEDYVKVRLVLLAGSLDKLDIVLQCPVCYQVSVEFNDESDVFCHFCDEKIEDFAEKYINNILDTYSYIKDGGEAPLLECPECGLETFINLDEDQYICLSCGITPTEDELATCDGPICNGIFVY